MPKASRKTTPKKDRSAEHETPAVYFRSIEVENVLCFKDKQVLNLSTPDGVPAQWTVILGDNGVGKTTLLRCLAGMELQEYLTYSESQTANERSNYDPLMIRPYMEMGLWVLTVKLNDNRNEINPKIQIKANVTYPVLIKILKDSSVINNAVKEGLIEVKFTSSATVGAFSVTSDKNMCGNLVCFGYGASRNLGATALSESLEVENSRSLFVEGETLINAEEWLLQTDYSRKYAEAENISSLDNSSQFQQIVDVLTNILPDIDDIRIKFTNDIPPHPRVEFKTPYGWVHIDNLGLGYRTAIAWMVDLAVRMFRRYPNSPDPLAEPAIVLVDEIDLHLHPRWQRTIMSFLSDRFPNTQFIVTAHSPLVVQAAKDANIVLLRREGDRVIIDNNPTIIENWRVDQVLSSVFELESDRPPHLDPLIKRRREILSQPHLSQADEKELKSLDAKIGPLPTATDPEDIKAMDIIRRAAHLLESI
jgi:predicted ATP-binding protein involved in virulence